jgi:Fe-S cluster biogenesis protein NfuA/nitrite reductase/ring-hydroxylating ferredoxin subunit
MAMAGEETIGRIQRLTAELERVQDPAARRLAEDLSAAVLELHGEGIERLLGALDDEARRAIAEDRVVGSLLLIHDLYPVPIEERVLEALDRVRPYMESHGGDVELLAIEDGIAMLRLKGSCDGCAASASTLELAVERELQESAPDLLGMHVEGAVTSAAGGSVPSVTGTPLPMAVGGEPAASNGNGAAPRALSDWVPVEGLEDIPSGQMRTAEVSGERLVVANVDGSWLAYRDVCPSCGSGIGDADLSDGVLACSSCDRRYFLPRAGRSLDDDRLQLDPVPLLTERGAGARVALPA